MKNVEFIEIIFENTESIIIPMNVVKNMDLGTLELIEDYPFPDSDAYYSQQVFLEINYDSELDLHYDSRDYEEPLGMFLDSPISNHVADRPHILGRITSYKDISCIDLLDEDEDSIKMIYVPWHDENEYENKYMATESGNGILKISIKKEDINEKEVN